MTKPPCTCRVTGSGWGQTRFDPKCPYHGDGGPMVADIDLAELRQAQRDPRYRALFDASKKYGQSVRESDRPGYDEACQVAIDRQPLDKGATRVAIDIAYPIIEAAVRKRVEGQFRAEVAWLRERDRTTCAEVRADERRRIVEALRAQERYQWSRAAEFIEALPLEGNSHAQ